MSLERLLLVTFTGINSIGARSERIFLFRNGKIDIQNDTVTLITRIVAHLPYQVRDFAQKIVFYYKKCDFGCGMWDHPKDDLSLKIFCVKQQR